MMYPHSRACLIFSFRLICSYGSVYTGSESKNNDNALETAILSTAAENNNLNNHRPLHFLYVFSVKLET